MTIAILGPVTRDTGTPPTDNTTRWPSYNNVTDLLADLGAANNASAITDVAMRLSRTDMSGWVVTPVSGDTTTWPPYIFKSDLLADLLGAVGGGQAATADITARVMRTNVASLGDKGSHVN